MIRNSTKIYNYLHDRFPDIPRLELKDASVELSEILKPQKKAHPLFNSFNELFDTYGQKYQKQIFFGPRTGHAINQIIERLETLAKKKNPHCSDDEILLGWEMVLQNLPDFYKASFDIVAISNKLDSILNQIRSDRKKQQPINTQAIADMLRNSRTGNTNHQ